MQIWKKLTICACGIMLTGALFGMTVTAAGPPLKDNACATCHKDYGAIMPKAHPDIGKGEACMSCHASDPANQEATKFSTEVHNVHKNGKANLECSACHAPCKPGPSGEEVVEQEGHRFQRRRWERSQRGASV